MPRKVIRREEAITVALVCHAEVLRLGLESLLSEAPGIELSQPSSLPSSGSRSTVAIVCERGVGGLAAECTRTREAVADEVIVVLNQADVHLMLDCVAAGACGFVLEGESPLHLIEAVRALAAGDPFVPPSLIGLLLGLHRAERTSRTERSQMEDVELLRLLAAGRSTPEIARILEVKTKTVRNRSSKLYRRLGARSRAEAIEIAEARRLLD